MMITCHELACLSNVLTSTLNVVQEETKTVGGKTVNTGVWKPSLTLLRIDRAALDVKWSPDGKKFAVASGAKSVPVCHYEADQVGLLLIL